MTQNGAINCKAQGPVPERLISANPGLKFCHDILFYLPMHCLEIVLSFLLFEVKAQQYFVSSRYMFLDKNTLLKIWLNPGLNLTMFRGMGPRWLKNNDRVARRKCLVKRAVYTQYCLNLAVSENISLIPSFCQNQLTQNEAITESARLSQWPKNKGFLFSLL